MAEFYSHFQFINYYLNYLYVIYFVTVFTFVVLFGLWYVLKSYLYFEKLKLTQTSRPTFPYGNFQRVIKGETSIHQHMWKHYKKLMGNNSNIGGIYLFTVPTLLLVVNDMKSIHELDVIEFKPTGFLSNFDATIKHSFPEEFAKHPEALREFLLQSTCILFGFSPIDILDDINQRVNVRYSSNLRYYLSLAWPIFKKSPKKMDDFMESLVDIRKKNDSDQVDLIEAIIRSDKSHLTEDIFNLFTDILTFSHSTVMFALYELSRNQQILQEVIGEIRRFNSKNKGISLDNLSELAILNNIVKETLRKYPPVATEILRLKENDCVSLPHSRRDLVVFRSILGQHRDGNNFVNADKFDPDRFIDNNIPSKYYQPFGSSSKLGSNLTELQVQLFLYSILSEYRTTIGSDLKIDPTKLYLCGSTNFKIKLSRH